MTDKSRKMKEQNRLREWRRQNCEEVKKTTVQVEKSFKWKGLRFKAITLGYLSTSTFLFSSSINLITQGRIT
jgi:hypothetical protein